jgi:hypothetical protein
MNDEMIKDGVDIWQEVRETIRYDEPYYRSKEMRKKWVSLSLLLKKINEEINKAEYNDAGLYFVKSLLEKKHQRRKLPFSSKLGD